MCADPAALADFYRHDFGIPLFQKDAARQNLEIGAKSGEELQRMVSGLIETPPVVFEHVERAIQIKGAEAIRGAGRE